MIWIVLLILLAASAAMSACETALFSLNRQTLQQFARSSSGSLLRVARLMQHPRRVLLTILITNTAVNVAFFTLAYVALDRLRATMPVLTTTAIALVPFVVIVFGEILPKPVALRLSREFAPFVALVISGMQLALRPILWLCLLLIDPITRLLSPVSAAKDDVSTDELRLLVEHSARQGHINVTENDMIQAVVAMSDCSVRDIMTPRVDIRYVTLDSSRAVALNVLEDTALRRVLVCVSDLDHIRGVLHARDLYLNPQAPIRTLVRRVRFVPEQVNLVKLLRYFREETVELAVVVDEYGGTAGLVTVDDVAEWVVGGLSESEDSAQNATEQIDENTYRLPGDLSARLWAYRFAIDDIEPDVDTLGGLIVSRLGRVPRPGDTVRIWNLTLTVESMKNFRIDRVLLKRDANQPAAEAVEI